MRLLLALAMTLVVSASSFGQTIEELKAENLALRKKLAVVTMNQLKEVALECCKHADANEGKFPQKASDLRESLAKHGGWRKLVAPYDEHPYKIAKRLGDNPDRIWIWLDNKSSFVFHGNAKPDEPIISERNPIVPGRMVMAFRDGHAETRNVGKK